MTFTLRFAFALPYIFRTAFACHWLGKSYSCGEVKNRPTFSPYFSDSLISYQVLNYGIQDGSQFSVFFFEFLFREQFCAAGMLLGLPLSIHRKSYWPMTFAMVAGTAGDWMEVILSSDFY